MQISGYIVLYNTSYYHYMQVFQFPSLNMDEWNNSSYSNTYNKNKTLKILDINCRYHIIIVQISWIQIKSQGAEVIYFSCYFNLVVLERNCFDIKFN